MANGAIRKKGNRAVARQQGRENGENDGDTPPDALHYAIMGSLLAGPPLLVLVVFLVISGGGAPVEPDVEATGPSVTTDVSDELTRREKEERELSKRIMNLMAQADQLVERAAVETRRFYDKEDEKEKMPAFKEAVRILQSAQQKLDEAYDLDRRGTHATLLDNSRQKVNRDLHNIMKDKPIYVE